MEMLIALELTPQTAQILTAGKPVIAFNPIHDIFGVAAQHSMLPETDDLTELAKRFGLQMHFAMQRSVPPGMPGFVRYTVVGLGWEKGYRVVLRMNP